MAAAELRIAVLAGALLIRCAPLNAGPIHVAVSIPPQKYLLDRIGGDRVDVSVILQPGQAPETFEPTPRQLALMHGARLYFRIGVPFERVWLETLTEPGSGIAVVDCCANILPQDPSDADAGHDPHVWVNPAHADLIAGQMEDAMARIDPAHAQFYSDHLAELRADLASLQREIRLQLSRRRISDFIIAHGALGPFADAYGLTQIPLEIGERSIGPRRLADIVRTARAEDIRVILVQRQFSSAIARTLASEIGARLVEVDPLAEDYIAGMRAIAAAIEEATR